MEEPGTVALPFSPMWSVRSGRVELQGTSLLVSQWWAIWSLVLLGFGGEGINLQSKWCPG